MTDTGEGTTGRPSEEMIRLLRNMCHVQAMTGDPVAAPQAILHDDLGCEVCADRGAFRAWRKTPEGQRLDEMIGRKKAS